jgi:hypothetical protein
MIIVLFSRKYKEAAPCRKECELGDGLEKPMLFVKADPNYTQEGVSACVPLMVIRMFF